jgi:hypothetical protein
LYLQDDLRIECETPEHRLYMAVGALGILLYPVRGAVERGNCRGVCGFLDACG